MGWTPQPVRVRNPIPAPTPPRETLWIRPINRKPYRVYVDYVYLIAGRPTAVCELFKTGECRRRFGTCRFSQPYRKHGQCSRAGCRFDHPADTEVSDDDGDGDSDASEGEDAFEVFGRRANICKFFTRGCCRYGERCNFAHPCDEGLRCQVQTCPLGHPLRR